MFYHNDFPRISDVKKMKDWASNGKLQSSIEVEYFDTDHDGWRATLWIMGIPEPMPLLIHEETPTAQDELIGKIVTFDNVIKSVQHMGQNKWLEMWIPSFRVID